MKIDEERDDAIREQLRRGRLWRGEGAFQSLMGDYYRVMAMVDAAGGEADPHWPARLYRAAAVILTARAEARAELDLERARPHA